MSPSAVLRRIAEHFVNRKPEIDLVEEKIDRLRLGGPLHEVIVNFYGVVGIGKTMLIQELYKRARGGGIPCALVDFAKDGRYADTPSGRVNVLEDLVRDLASQSDLQPQSFSRQVSSYWRLGQQDARELESAQTEIAGTLTELWITYTKDLLERKGRIPLVLFFDTTERAPEPMIRWLESSLFVPLLKTDRAVIVLAGRTPLRWRVFEVRRRVHSHQIHPFSESMVAEQLDAYRPLAKVIREVTFGHPDATRQAAVAVHAIEERGRLPVNSESFEAHYKVGVVQQVVKYLLHEGILKSARAEVRCAFQWLAPLRRCDVDIAGTILSEISAQEDEDARQMAFPDRQEGIYYLALIGEMVRTTLMQWDSSRKAYAVDDTIRRIQALDLKLSHADIYMMVHKNALSWYRNWIKRVPEGYLVEILFHQTCIWQEENRTEDLAALLRAELDSYLEPLGQEARDIEAIASRTRLSYELRDDDELKEMWGPALHNSLLASIGPRIP